MKRLGIKVTEEELKHIRTQHEMSGMWTSDGTPFGDPAYEIGKLAKKYNLPVETGLDLTNGEFVSPNE